MDISVTGWQSELGKEEPTINHQNGIGSLDNFSTQQTAAAHGEGFQHTLSENTLDSFFSFDSLGNTTVNPFGCPSMEYSHMGHFDMPTDKPSCNFGTTGEQVSVKTPGPLSPSPCLLSFGKLESPPYPQELRNKYEALALEGSKMAGTVYRQHTCTLEHVVAERKRREKLNQLFIELSAIIPDLKKTSKITLLGDTISYVKQLEAKVKTHEEQAASSTMVSAVLEKKPGNTSNSSGNLYDGTHLKLEASISDKTVFLKIHCKTREKVLVKALSEIEKLHLTVISTNLIAFPDSSHDITVIAQAEVGFSMTVKDLVENLSLAFNQFM